MAQPVIQHAFHAGEWAPQLYARVDLQKYHAAAALMRNYYVDYRGGASSRYGTKYILQAFKSATKVRLIPFQASFTVSYVLEFGQNYIRFINNGTYILETAKNITGASQANPCQITSVAHGFSAGDWVFITGVGGMTQLNGKFYEILTASTNTFTIGKILDGSNVNSLAYTAYTAGGTVARVYTLPSPYAASDLALVKFAQNVNTLVFTHPSYVPYILTLISATNWTMLPITFGATINTPTGLIITTTGAGSYNFSYVVTAVDINGQESIPSTVARITIASTFEGITLSWTAVSGAVSYNIYRAGPALSAVVPTGSAFGFITNVTGTSIVDTFTTNGVPLTFTTNYAIGIPIAENPFQGAGLASINVTASGTYTTVPNVTIGAAPSGGATATATAILQVVGTPPTAIGSIGFIVGDVASATIGSSIVTLVVATVDGLGECTSVQPITYPGSNPGAISSGNNPVELGTEIPKKLGR